MYYFNIILTEKCNANCSHCYMGSRKNDLKSLTTTQIDKIIDRIPQNTKKIVLTGGEIFLEKDLLMYTLNKINKLKENIEIELESNGIYFYINNTLEKLMEFNKKISAIRFSDDPFHRIGGIDLEKVRGLKKYQPKLEYKIKYLVQDKALKIGKAENLSENLVKKSNCMNTIRTKENPYFFLDIKGNIYLCPWKLVKPIGNIYSEDIEAILRKLKEPFNERILTGKIEEAFSLKNGNIEEYKNYSKIYGQCMLCNRLYNINKKEL